MICSFITPTSIWRDSRLFRTDKKWISSQDDYKSKDLVFELWCTSGFESDAIRLLKKHTKSVRKYDIKYFDGSAIAKKFKRLKDNKSYDLLMRYFMPK